MSRAFPVLAVLTAAVCLPQDLTTADAIAILRNSPWSYEVKTSFAYYNPGRGTFKRPPGTSPSSYPDPNARMPTMATPYTPTGNTLTVVFQFPTELTITPNDPEVRFRAFV